MNFRMVIILLGLFSFYTVPSFGYGADGDDTLLPLVSSVPALPLSPPANTCNADITAQCGCAIVYSNCDTGYAPMTNFEIIGSPGTKIGFCTCECQPAP